MNKIKHQGSNRSCCQLNTEEKSNGNDNDASRNVIINPGEFTSTLPREDYDNNNKVRRNPTIWTTLELEDINMAKNKPRRFDS